MTDSNGDQRRTRRRAVRSVGPPADESAAPGVTSIPAEQAKAGVPVRAASPGPGSDRVPTPVDAVVADAGTIDPGTAADTETGAVATVETADKTADVETVELGKTTSTSAIEPDASPADATESKSRRGVGRILAFAAAAILVLALVVGAGLSVVKARSIDARDERRTEFVQTARQAALNLTTIRADSAKQDIDRILAVASGQFKSEFDGRVDPFLNVVQQAKIVSNGEVVEAALESDDVDSAQVLVAVKQTLTNAGQEGPQTRLYRFRITVSRGDAGLTASKVEFVG
ncbi:Mce protein [Nocardia brasiliensis]|uniref:Mce protein n=1 Tax=Nocardia brasiliensis TaxID=37326 RepID=UPI003D8BFF82